MTRHLLYAKVSYLTIQLQAASSTLTFTYSLQNFQSQLKHHLLAQILNLPFSSDEEDFTDKQLNSVIIVNDTISQHKVLQVNYTTYDLRREQDLLNPRTHADIMVLSNEDRSDSADVQSHPFWYARIIGVFHVQVLYAEKDKYVLNSDFCDMDFLWVRWYGPCCNFDAGWKAKRLHRLSFINETTDDTHAFGFVDPACVV